MTSCQSNDKEKVAGRASDSAAADSGVTAAPVEKSSATLVPVDPLERGKPADLARVDFQKVDLDQLFVNLAYLKGFRLGEPTIKYNGDKPLVIKKFALYHISDMSVIDRYARREVDVIKKGQLYGDTVTIERSVPLEDMRDPDLRPLGYWGNKDVLFNKIFTSSTKNNKLIRLRLQSDELSTVTEKTYQELVSVLTDTYKGNAPKIHKQGNGRPDSYEWKLNDQNVQISFLKDEGMSYITLMKAFINPDTKGFLPEFGN